MVIKKLHSLVPCKISPSISDSVSLQLFPLTILQFLKFAAFLLPFIKTCQILTRVNAGKVFQNPVSVSAL